MPKSTALAQKFETAIQTGKEFHNNKNYGRAISEYTTALKIDPNSVNALELRAKAYVGKRDFRRALDDLSKLIEVVNSNRAKADGYRLRGLVYRQMNDSHRAAEDFRSAIHTDPDYAPAQESLAHLQSRRKGRSRFG